MARRNYYHGLGNAPGPAERTAGVAVTSAGHFDADNHQVLSRTREDYLIIACVRGCGVYEAGEKHFDIAAGDIFVALPGIPHTYLSDSIKGWEILYAHFEGDLAGRFVETAGYSASRMVMPLGAECEAVQGLRAVCAALERQDVHSGLDATRVLIDLFLSIAKQGRMHRIGEGKLDLALEGDFNSVEEMADAAGMSKFHFIREFKRAVGVTPWRYVLGRRVSRAKELLASTDLAVKQIAYRLGYDDANYFSRLFRQETGVSASEYRQTLAR